GTAAQHLPLPFAAVFNPDHGANTIPVRACAAKSYTQSVVSISAIVAKQKRRAGVGRDEQIEIAVIINIGIGSATGDPGSAERRSCRGCRFLELPISQIAK